MNEKNKIQNPLTIIAIFAGLAEIAGTAVLLGLPLEIQRIFVWFVMLFPAGLVLIFFAVLAFKHKVLYAPSDFTNENLFVQILSEKVQGQLAEVGEMVGEAKALSKHVAKDGSPDDAVLLAAFNNKLDEIEKKLESTKFTATSPELMGTLTVRTALTPKQRQMITLLKNAGPDGLSAEELCEGAGVHPTLIHLHTMALIDQGIIVREAQRYYIQS